MTLRRLSRALFRQALLSIGLVVTALLAAESLFLSNAQAATTAMTSSYLNLRTAPVPTSTILMIVPPQVALTVNGEASGGYFPVAYGENSGWVSTELVQVDMRNEPAAAESFDENKLLPEGMATLVESVNLRTGPGTGHDALRVIDAGTQVEATGEISGAYEKVKIGDEEGWVRSVYVDRGPEPVGDDVRQAEVIAAALAAGRPLVTPGVSVIVDAEIVLRAEPSASSQKVEVIPIHSNLTLTGNTSDGYVEAQFGSKKGWVAAGYLRQEAVPQASPPDVPVLMYHSIQETGAEYQVTAGQLEEQLQWLSQNGYESITSADLQGWMTYGIPLPEKPVMITIDDGNFTDWIFLELLERYGFEGVFALPNYAQLTPAEIRTLDRAGEVCGHTVSHQNLSTLDYDGQYYEIAENKEFLEGILGNEITCFAYPFGAYNELTPFVVIEAGYLMAFDVSGGPQPLDTSIDRWHILRINVSGNGTLDDFIASLESWE
jgi:uncharacterized protein YraI/peptidoglycan/xylan/chitin deacetylase (PgdA/CDA1 family)